MSARFSLSRIVAALLISGGLCGGLTACGTSAIADLPGTPSVTTAQIALAGGSPSVALRICDGLVVKQPNDTAALVCRGDALVALGRNAEATPSYQAALRANPHALGAEIGLGRIALQTDAARAEALFLRALSDEPRNATALNDLGIARDLQGRHAEAQTAYGEAIAAAPDMRAAQVNLALSLAMSGKSGEAIRIIQPIASRADATERERHDLAAVLAMDGKNEEAERLLRSDLSSEQADEAVAGYRSLQPH
jgi:Flp pilus assembly protein TadD